MPYFKTITEWHEQSSLLLKARPTTARITSKYTVLKPSASKVEKRRKFAANAKPADASRASSPPPAAQNPEEPIATFRLKTYDPESGTCLQYETNKAAEVGRLIGNLGRLGRGMAALPEIEGDGDLSAPAPEGEAKVDAGGDVKMGGVADKKVETGTGGGKKKKKGKK
ncbi:hypothetical protein P153DRAFT_297866 [Dothidotthia symphoricarpi CBS 119687]|uniref:SRP9 domain-containing protein n=1 Tax=Dothidotthia symphoricarpi CBS 119687 TaxID=1392245 RepID=A0A6A6A672_9PLEO|nr:uncharacterized protein P153DRAFT_297866 [Dothidotthia symphoricarpi CBS 119687]KAF2126417.1 hypothetical protein P153DRAFT_297866 [Dothidotthia symphoricarpi CBS 119687]